MNSKLKIIINNNNNNDSEDKWKTTYQEDFLDACEFGNYNMVKKINEKYNIENNFNLLNDSFKIAIESDKIHICEWMLKTFSNFFNHHITIETISNCFLGSCIKGNINSCRWLFQNFDLSFDKTFCFYHSYMMNQDIIVNFFLEEVGVNSKDIENFEKTPAGEYTDKEIINKLKEKCDGFLNLGCYTKPVKN
jgi:hypothetical protein